MELSHAINFVKELFDGKVDKSGSPYINHIMGVFNIVQDCSYEVKMIALLHDIIEDTDFDLRTLDISEEIIKAVEILSKRGGERYEDFIRRIVDSGNKDAIMVKYADVMQNMLPWRLNNLKYDDALRLSKKYAYASSFLFDVISTYRWYK